MGEVIAGARPGATAPCTPRPCWWVLSLSFPVCRATQQVGKVSGKELGPPLTRRLTLAMRVTTATHQHVNTCSLDPCSVGLSPSRLASILPVPTEASQSKEAWSSRRLDFGDGRRQALGGQANMPPPKLGARRACHSLFALGGRHHDGTGCGWGGAGGAEVEMFPLPTL